MKAKLTILFLFVCLIGFGQNERSSLRAALEGYWKFEETSGTTSFDETSTSNDGTITGATVNQTGKVGKCYLYNASTEKVVISNESNFDVEYNEPFSISCWAYRNSNGITRFFFAKQLSSGNFTGWTLFQASDNKMTWELVSVPGTSHLGVNRASYSTTGTWFHLCATYDGSEDASGAKIYINGSESSTTQVNTLSSSITNNVSPEIGNRNGAFNFNGNIDELMFYKRELSQLEVDLLYNSNTGLLYAQLNFLKDFDYEKLIDYTLSRMYFNAMYGTNP